MGQMVVMSTMGWADLFLLFKNTVKRALFRKKSKRKGKGKKGDVQEADRKGLPSQVSLSMELDGERKMLPRPPPAALAQLSAESKEDDDGEDKLTIIDSEEEPDDEEEEEEKAASDKEDNKDQTGDVGNMPGRFLRRVSRQGSALLQLGGLTEVRQRRPRMRRSSNPEVPVAHAQAAAKMLSRAERKKMLAGPVNRVGPTGRSLSASDMLKKQQAFQLEIAMMSVVDG